MDTAQILADLRAQRERISQAITALEALEETAVSRPTAKAATKAAAVKSGKTAAVAPPAAKKRVISPEGTQADGGGSAEALGDEEKGSKTCGRERSKLLRRRPREECQSVLISPESRKKMAEAQQKRWAKKKRAVKAAAKKAAAAPVATAAVKEAAKA